jgi:FkbM family methyltransferase
MPRGWEKVGGCGGLALYPRWVWERRGYGTPEPFPQAGNEVNFLCRCPGIESYVTFNVKVLREAPEEMLSNSLIKRIRTTLGLRTRLGIRSATVEKDGLRWTSEGVSDASVAFGGHEDFLRREILARGSLFIDIGAHVGTWAVRASRYFDRVVAIEPNQEAFEALRRNIALNRIENITAILGAASDREGRLALFKYPHSSWTSTLRTSMGHSTTGQKIDVRCFTVDSLNLQPTLVKIDTEGHEAQVLLGMKSTLKSKPKLVVEIHNNMDEVTDLLETMGYDRRTVVQSSDTKYLVCN